MSREPSSRRYGRFFGADPRRDIDEELAFHLAMRKAEAEASGESAEAATAAARERFGNFEKVRTEMEQLARRRTSRGRRASIVDIFRQDIRFALRTFASNRAYAAAVIVTLAIGVAANTLVFSVAYGVLIQPLPYRDAETIVRLWSRNTSRNLQMFSVSPGDYHQWRTQSRTFSAVGAYERQREATLLAGSTPIAVSAAAATPAVFSVLGTTPMIGRRLEPLDSLPENRNVAVISHRLWRTEFGSDDAIVGRRISLDGRPLTIVGVMPPRFALPANDADVWTPLDFGPVGFDYGAKYLRILGRLAPGVTMPQAQMELNTIAARLAQEYPEGHVGWDVNAMLVSDNVIGLQFRRAVLLLAGVVGFVLLIACANAANLQLARGSARRRELALRTALGASHRRVMAQLTTESMVLALAGGIIGVGLAQLGLTALRDSAVGLVPRIEEVRVNLPVLLEALAVVVAATLLTGLLPSRMALRADIAASLKSSGSGSAAPAGGDRVRSGLVIAEIALSIVLLVGAGLLTRSFVRLSSVELGFAADGVSIATMRPPAGDTSEQWRAQWFHQVAERVRMSPGVEAAAGISSAPFAGANSGSVFARADRPLPPRDAVPAVDLRAATSDYFRTLGIRLLRGRDFSATDRANGTPSIVISKTLADRYFGAEDPIGKRLRVGNIERGTELTIIGVADDVKYMELEAAEMRPMVYLSAAWDAPQVATLVVRGRDAGAVASAIRTTLSSLAPAQPAPAVTPLSVAVDRAMATRRFALLLFGVFAGIALLLAAIGIYGVMSYMVRQRTQEIGIRLALGASPRSIMGSVIGRTLRLSLIGLAIGMTVAWMLRGAVESLLYGVEPSDPATYFAIGGMLLLVALLAALVPARRAMAADPASVIRGS